MDVLFIDFPSDFHLPESGWCLGFRYMISSLRKNGFSAKLLHAPRMGGRIALIAEIVRRNPRIVGLTTYDITLAALLEFAADLRRAGLRSHITVGGMCASAIPEEILKGAHSVDSVALGEGEGAIVELAKQVVSDGRWAIPGFATRVGDGVVRGETRPLAADLDALAPPALDDVASDYVYNGCVPVVASRGCYGRCTFCCIQRYYRSCTGPVWRGRRPAKIVDEIVDVTMLSNARNVTFVDENFMGPGAIGRRHAAEVGIEIKRRGLGIQFNFGCRPNDVDRATMAGLKEAGLAGVTLGVESMGREALELFNKRTTPEINHQALRVLEELEIPTEITFIFFHPLSTLEEIGDNLEFVERVRNSKFSYFNKNQPFSEFVPFFGTELTGRLTERGLVTRTLSGYQVRYADPRVGFIVQRVLSVPVEHVAKLDHCLAVSGSKQASELRAALLNYYFDLNMVRLPALTAELSRLFRHGESVESGRVTAVAAEFDRERHEVSKLIEVFSDCASGIGEPWRFSA